MSKTGSRRSYAPVWLRQEGPPVSDVLVFVCLAYYNHLQVWNKSGSTTRMTGATCVNTLQGCRSPEGHCERGALQRVQKMTYLSNTLNLCSTETIIQPLASEGVIQSICAIRVMGEIPRYYTTHPSRYSLY